MNDSNTKTAVVFRPKRQWKPKRRDRNITRRRKRKQWWRKNRFRLKSKRKRRQRQLANNSVFKAWRKKRQSEKVKRRFRMAFPQFPESWFLFREELPETMGLGMVRDYDPDQEELLILDAETGEEKVVSLDQFLSHSEFLEGADLENFLLILDQFYGEPRDDLDIIPESEEAPQDLPSLVVSRWVRAKMAFNKENPSELLGQLLKVFEKGRAKSQGQGEKRIKDILSQLKALTKKIQDAWAKRHEE